MFSTFDNSFLYKSMVGCTSGKNRIRIPQHRRRHSPEGLMPRHGSQGEESDNELTADENKHHLGKQT